MLKIGEFSRLSQVTVKTLHHYDDIGLLVPAHVDTFTNHRFYSADQLISVHRIMALKGLGLSLEQIKLMLDEELDLQEVRGMLRLKQSEIQQRLREEQAQLAQVEFRLRMLEMEAAMPEIEVTIKDIREIHALSLRRSIRREHLVQLGLEFEKAQAQHNIRLVGPVGEIRYEEEFSPEFEDVEFFWPVDSRQTENVTLESMGTLELRIIPALQTAAFMHKGVHTQSPQEALLTLQRWLVANEYRLGGTNRAIYHHGPHEHAEYEDWIIEIQHEIVSV
jgi:DNA-binding transcriptional MerR regulator